jgi:hypothetical protein
MKPRYAFKNYFVKKICQGIVAGFVERTFHCDAVCAQVQQVLNGGRKCHRVFVQLIASLPLNQYSINTNEGFF